MLRCYYVTPACGSVIWSMTCISSENAFISTWHQIFKDAAFGLLGARVKFEILLSIAQSHYSGLLKFPGGSASQLFIAHIDLDLASLGTVINILLEKAFRKAVWRLFENGDFCDFSASVLSHADVSQWSL